MATKKAGGTAKNLRDSNPKYLGIKLYDGQIAQIGSVLVRQRGTKVLAGKNVMVGKDHTLFSAKKGIVKYGIKRKTKYDGQVKKYTIVNVI
jgi:large subunit ribosomal protein L27